MKVVHLDYRPGLAVTMKAVVQRLTEEEAAQVAEYLQGL
jgi:cytochrome c553